jgi:hypothetical protein
MNVRRETRGAKSFFMSFAPEGCSGSAKLEDEHRDRYVLLAIDFKG